MKKEPFCVSTAVSLVKKYYNYYFSSITSEKVNQITKDIKSWYQYTDITDPFDLAAAALWFGEYKVPRDYKKSYDEVLIAKKILLETEKNI